MIQYTSESAPGSCWSVLNGEIEEIEKAALMTFDLGIFAGKGTRIIRTSTNLSSNILSMLNLETAARGKRRLR
jgi:hypothetical protein